MRIIESQLRKIIKKLINEQNEHNDSLSNIDPKNIRSLDYHKQIEISKNPELSKFPDLYEALVRQGNNDTLNIIAERPDLFNFPDLFKLIAFKFHDGYKLAKRSDIDEFDKKYGTEILKHITRSGSLAQRAVLAKANPDIIKYPDLCVMLARDEQEDVREDLASRNDIEKAMAALEILKRDASTKVKAALANNSSLNL